LAGHVLQDAVLVVLQLCKQQTRSTSSKTLLQFADEWLE
jgi:hypothetical protein